MVEKAMQMHLHQVTASRHGILQFPRTREELLFRNAPRRRKDAATLGSPADGRTLGARAALPRRGAKRVVIRALGFALACTGQTVPTGT